MARFEQANAPAQLGQSATSNYYDYLAAVAQDEARGINSGGGAASDKKENAKQVKTMFDTLDFYTQFYTDKWKNREITGAQFDQQMASLLKTVLPNIDWWLQDDKLDSLNEGTVNTLQARKNELVTLEKGEGGSANSPFFAIDHKIAHPELYNDFQDPTKPNSLFRSQGQGSVSINGVQYQIDSNKYLVPKIYNRKVGTDPVTGKEIIQDIKTPSEALDRFIIKLQDPNDPQAMMDVYYTPFSGREPYVTLDPNSPNGVKKFDPSTYKPIVKTPYLVHDTQGGSYYKIVDGQKSLVKDGEPLDLLQAKEVDSSVLSNFKDYLPPTAPLAPPTVPQSAPAEQPQPQPQQQPAQPRILNVSNNFLQPKDNRIGAPKSRFGSGFGGGGGGSF